jgi:hypothetical protein
MAVSTSLTSVVFSLGTRSRLDEALPSVSPHISRRRKPDDLLESGPELRSKDYYDEPYSD